MMIFAIKRVNQRRALPNVTLGYDVYDTCGDVSLAMRMALNMSIDQLDPECGLLLGRKPSSAPNPRVKAVIGEGSSEVSIAVARILTLSSIAQVGDYVNAFGSLALCRQNDIKADIRTTYL